MKGWYEKQVKSVCAPLSMSAKEIRFFYTNCNKKNTRNPGDDATQQNSGRKAKKNVN